MNVTDYTYLMNKPEAITEKQTDALGSVLNEFPYFQSARALRLKGLYIQNSFKYNYALKVTAAHTADRSVLFDFITSENFTAIQNDFYEQKLRDLLEIKVFDSEIISAEEIQKAIEVKIDPVEQSILDSIKEASTPAEKSREVEEPVANNEEPVVVTTEEPIIEKEPAPNFPEIDLSIFNAIKEAQTVTFERPEKTEEPKAIPVIDDAIFKTLKEAENVTYEKPQQEQEPKVDPIERSILNSIKESETVSVVEPSEAEEPKVDSGIERSILSSIKEAEAASAEKPAQIAIEEEEDDSVIEEMIIPESRFGRIEESILSSIKESAAVVTEAKENLKEDIAEEPAKEEIPTVEEKPLVEEEQTVEIQPLQDSDSEKPVDFSLNEKHSFQEWLQLSRTEPIDRTKDENEKAESKSQEEIVNEQRQKKAEIIDKFIENNPKISPIKSSGINIPVVALDSNSEDNSYLMTETLARVYLDQKKYTKAIQAYEILILKYPEKISFFADRIADIKILQQNNNNNN
ncbi:tetratricopeptide repeat protein [Flavobacterium foetidum]|uniref:tetratricopeptide repeat protein n=1 Tax=Flavobacterium foetidum TaxID=2026681 RepID=UPI001074B887|nr:tetratricopeptide repeat protein [Flavobacterium foetidum]KAF2515269.1 hypothetical protein E0W73_10050 [Flavobacterium foetidum]